jgi:glycosyltransferase involved in cell wall biosynthesis
MTSRPPSTAPEVSVVIPAYNSEGFLEEAVDSVYAQTVRPREVIVVNDGSTDATESLLRRLAARLPPTFRWVTKGNGGSASARNVGIGLASGRFIAFLDHDDLWASQKLARQLDQFAADPDLSLSFTAMRVTPYERAEGGSLKPGSDEGPGSNAGLIRPPSGVSSLHPDWNPEPEAVLERLIAIPQIGSLSTVMIRREAINRMGGFNEKIRVSDDWLLWLNMAAAGMKFGHIPEMMVEYRLHEGNLTRSRLQHSNDLTRVFDEFLATNELPRDIRRRIRLRWWCAHRHLVTAIGELQAGNKKQARHHILKAARVHPQSIRPGWIRMLGIGPPPRAPEDVQEAETQATPR